MNNKEYAKKLEKRTKDFALKIIILSSKLPNTIESKIVRNQLTKSGTSVGANYREANRSRSKADFRNKTKICESEASETQYWLEIVVEMKWVSIKEVEFEVCEISELLAIFTSINSKL